MPKFHVDMPNHVPTCMRENNVPIWNQRTDMPTLKRPEMEKHVKTELNRTEVPVRSSRNSGGRTQRGKWFMWKRTRRHFKNTRRHATQKDTLTQHNLAAADMQKGAPTLHKPRKKKTHADMPKCAPACQNRPPGDNISVFSSLDAIFSSRRARSPLSDAPWGADDWASVVLQVSDQRPCKKYVPECNSTSFAEYLDWEKRCSDKLCRGSGFSRWLWKLENDGSLWWP